MKSDTLLPGAFRLFARSVALMVFLGAPAANAATITVADMTDANSQSVNCTLRDAITCVNAGLDLFGCVAAGLYGASDTINVPAGTYTITGTPLEDANATGDLDITNAVTITGAGAGSTTIDGNAIDRVFHVTTNVPVTFDSVTITGGDVRGAIGCWNNCGGGILAVGDLTLSSSIVTGNLARQYAGIYAVGAVTLTNSTVSNNTALWYAGIYAVGAVTLTDSTVSGNIATTGTVGGIRANGALTLTNSIVSNNSANSNIGGIYSNSTVALDNSIVSNNSAGVDGGGIYAFSSLTLNNSTVSGNTAGGRGGGIYDAGDSGAVLTISGSTISNNTAGTDGGGIWKTSSIGATVNITNTIIDNNQSSGWGGGIALWGANTTTVTGSTISNNTSSGQGGGIFNTSSLTVSDSTFSGNNSSSNHGGGLYTSWTTSIVNSTFSSNNALWSGGGIHQTGSTVSIDNSTFSGNNANTSGGGIFSTAGTTTITNVTLTANTAPTGGGIFNSGSTVNLSNTLIANQASGGDCSGGISTTVNDLDSDGSCGVATTADPLLGGLANNGGTTMTHALLTGSPAIDAGTCVNATDQIGTIRPQDGDGDGVADCDIGAFEFPLVVSGCTDPTASNYAPTAIIDDGSCIYAGITITVVVTDGEGGRTTKTLTLTPQP